MTVTTTPPTQLNEEQLNLLLQTTVETYKTFEKLAENLPNPMAMSMFKQFAVDEREIRDLIEMKMEAIGASRVRVTLAGDLLFQDILEGSLTYRAITESLIMGERRIEKKLNDLARGATVADRPLLVYLASSKRAHIVELERELELIKLDPDWFKREDAEWRIVHGFRPE